MTRTIGMLAVLCLAVCLGSCGADPGDEGLSFSLDPRALPAEAIRVAFYVLPSRLFDGTSATCDRFMGSAAPKNIFDYSTDFITNRTESISDPSEAVTIEVKGLPEGILMFYLEVQDDTFSTIACGCGDGQIAKGDKTFIPIHVVDDCK